MTDTITIVGVIGTDPEKKNPLGVPITTFRVASKERRFDRATGGWVNGDTNWYTCSAYRRLGEHVFESLRRRDRVILTGRLRVRNWDTGERRGTSVDIDVDAIGHDLLFGTTTFVSSDATSPSAATPESASDSWDAPARSDATWAAPGTETAEGASVDTPESSGESGGDADEAQRPVLVGQTPF